MERLLNNIHGTDAALLAICIIMWQLNTTKVNFDLAMHTITCMMYLGIGIMVGRVLLSLIHSFRLRRVVRVS